MIYFSGRSKLMWRHAAFVSFVSADWMLERHVRTCTRFHWWYSFPQGCNEMNSVGRKTKPNEIKHSHECQLTERVFHLFSHSFSPLQKCFFFTILSWFSTIKINYKSTIYVLKLSPGRVSCGTDTSNPSVRFNQCGGWIHCAVAVW